jgi:hypothetical protein
MIQNPDDKIHDNIYSQLGKLYTARVCHTGMDVAEEQRLKVLRASNSMGNSLESPKYTMPWIQRRIITTRQVKLCYDQAMAEHHKIKMRYYGPKKSKVALVFQTRDGCRYQATGSRRSLLFQLGAGIRKRFQIAARRKVARSKGSYWEFGPGGFGSC